MILPIVGFGHPALREETEEIGPDYPELEELIANMYETMYNANGVGIAAPQIGLSIRLFVVDGSPMQDMVEDDEIIEGFKRVFINPQKIEELGKKWDFEEGCLSIPDIREMVSRPNTLSLKYMNENFEEKTETFTGLKARILQHEYDHLEGKLFTDYVSAFRRQMVKKRLNRIAKGEIHMDYPMKFAR